MSSIMFRISDWFPQRLKVSRLRAVIVLGLVVCVVLGYTFFNEEARQARKFTQDSYLAMSWEGFGPEKGQYNFTLVTAMMDIGRGQWAVSGRSYNTYLLHLQRVLRLDVNLVIFSDAQALPFIQWMRRGREVHTHTVVLDVKDLPYYAYHDRMQVIMDSEQYRADNELVRNHKVEAFIPEYDILQWSKLYFLNESIRLNVFHSSYFIWLDGGYGHGKDIHPPDGVWKLKGLFEFADKVTFIERESVDKYREHADRLHKMSVNIMAGGFVAGGSRALQRLYELQQQVIAGWMTSNVVDDDQSANMLIYFKHPELFHLVRADWDDVFKVFNVH